MERTKSRHATDSAQRNPNAFSRLRKGLTAGLVVLGMGVMVGSCAGKQTESTAAVASAGSLSRRLKGDSGLTRLRQRVVDLESDEAGSVKGQRRIAETLIRARVLLKRSESVDLDGTAAMMVLQAGEESEGQVQMKLEKVTVDVQRQVHAKANVIPTVDTEYCWLFYQENGRVGADGGPSKYLLNPRYDEEDSQPTYIGVVMRGVTLTNGTSGDFVVRVYGNATRPSSAESEWDPVVWPDGRVRPADVLYRLEPGSLIPDINTLDFADTCRMTSTPQATVTEYGPTTPVVLIRHQ